ncbi:MAG: acyltransferase domain-containing protein, partial [Candidatus Competibacteraceae bacterium]|nr:acyltransferase domain-containing protein [Candidatus Competibacteraceae bacterium]
DPVEAEAVGRAIGSHKTANNPLLIGSVKTNIGHLESASGMAGLSKVILCLQHRLVPPSLHFSIPNPNIPFADLNLRVVTRPTPLSNASGPVLIGVNSFGFGGANAHALLSEFVPNLPVVTKEPEKIAGYIAPLLISARSKESLNTLANSYLKLVADESLSFVEIARAAAMRREHHSYRLAVLGTNRAEIAGALDSFATGPKPAGICHAHCHAGAGRIVGVFSGNGAQWLGMGRRLFETEPEFRRWIETVDSALSVHTQWSIVDELFADEEQSRLAMTDIAQPLLFAIQVALWEVLRERGVVFAAVLGHSVGEVAAAYAAGILDLQNAVKVIFERSRFQQHTQGQGRMAAAALSVDDARREIADFDERIEIAAVNSPKSITLAGPLTDLQLLGERLTARNIFYRLLDLDYAFHSRVMDTIEDGLCSALQPLKPKARQIRFVSTVTGNDLQGSELDAQYWWRNVRCPVRFHDAVELLVQEGHEVFLELGPHAILQYYLNETIRARESHAAVIGTLDRKEPEDIQLARGLGQIYVHGGKVDFRRLYRGGPSHQVPLPLYPWNKEHHWFEETPESLRYLHGEREHPLLGFRQSATTMEWQSLIDTDLFPWLADHVVNGATLLPAAAFTEMAFAAAAALFDEAPLEIEQLDILRPLELTENKSRVLQFAVTGEIGSFTISSRGYLETGGWIIHAVGQLLRGTEQRISHPDAELLSLIQSGTHRRSADHYNIAQRLGLHYGPAFQCVDELWSNAEWSWAKLCKPPTDTTDLGGYLLHPSLLDGCLQTLFAILMQFEGNAENCLYLPTVMGACCFASTQQGPPILRDASDQNQCPFGGCRLFLI